MKNKCYLGITLIALLVLMQGCNNGLATETMRE